METERLFIRRFMPDDWQDLFEYLSQEEIVMFEPYGVFTEEASKQEAIKRSKEDKFWAVCLKDKKKLIGNVCLCNREFSAWEQYGVWELGYVFNKNYQGKGYATEASRVLVDDTFRNHNAHRVEAMCNPMNTKSWKLLERLGFHREGHLLQDTCFKKDKTGQPIWTDTYIYGILASEWLARTV